MSASSTSFTVAALTNYPTVPFTIAVEQEIILVGGTTGLTLNNLTRGYDGTTATSHASGINVAHKAIAADFENKWLDVVVYDDAVTAYDDEFDDGVLSSEWTAVTPTGTASWTEHRGVLSVVGKGQSAGDCAALLQSLNGLSYPLFVVTAMRRMSYNQNYWSSGLVFTDGTNTTSNAVWYATRSQSGGARANLLRSGTLTNISTTAWSLTTTPRAWTIGWEFHRLDWISTNTWRGWSSADGISWLPWNQTEETITLTPTHYGPAVSTEGGAQNHSASFDFFRVYTAKPSYWQEGS